MVDIETHKLTNKMTNHFKTLFLNKRKENFPIFPIGKNKKIALIISNKLTSVMVNRRVLFFNELSPFFAS